VRPTWEHPSRGAYAATLARAWSMVDRGIIRTWADLILRLSIDSLLGRTRPARFAHSGLHAKLGQDPDLEGDPNAEKGDRDEIFHFRISAARGEP
jgi:hypothetical protein